MKVRREEGRKEGRKGGRKEGRKEGRKKGRKEESERRLSYLRDFCLTLLIFCPSILISPFSRS